jgi:nucleolar protein 58
MDGWIVEKELKGKLAVAEAKLGGLIKDSLEIACIHDQAVEELMRGIRSVLQPSLL